MMAGQGIKDHEINYMYRLTTPKVFYLVPTSDSLKRLVGRTGPIRPDLTYAVMDAVSPKFYATLMYARDTWGERIITDILSQYMDTTPASGFQLRKSTDKHKYNQWTIESNEPLDHLPHYVMTIADRDNSRCEIHLLVSGRPKQCPKCRNGCHATKDCPEGRGRSENKFAETTRYVLQEMAEGNKAEERATSLDRDEAVVK